MDAGEEPQCLSLMYVGTFRSIHSFFCSFEHCFDAIVFDVGLGMFE